MLGSDFEGFLRMDNAYIPAERVLKGDKDSPISISKGVVGHPDNVMAEAAIAAPVQPRDFAAAINDALYNLQRYIEPATFHAEPSVKFTEDWLSKSEFAKEVGCEPDYDTFNEMYQYTADDLGLYRFAGFHIHFDVMDSIPSDYAARVVDCTVGLASVAFEWDSRQGRRRALYGTPGRHRPKSYGIEYRTLSSSMITHLDEAQPIIESTALALQAAEPNIMMLPQLMWDAVSEAIRTEDVGMAKVLWEEVKGNF